MEREPPPVTVTAPGSGGPPPDVLEGAPASRRPGLPVRVLAVVGVVVLGAAVVRGAGSSPPRPSPSPPPPPPAALSATSGITATASLAGARADAPFVQRLTVTVALPAYDGRGDSGGRLLGDEVVLLDVRVRGFAVEPDDRSLPLPLGRFGRANSGRSTTIPLEATATVTDCSVETLAPRDLDLTVRTGEGPQGVVRAVVEPAVVRALDRLVSRTCRRPRG